MREILESTFRQALAGTHPRELTARALPDERPALVMALGKAAMTMLEAARERFPGVAWLATPPAPKGAPPTTDAARPSAEPGGSADGGPGPGEREPASGELLPGSHPLPDDRSVRAAERALERAAALGADDLLLLLVSGGGSALWSAPEHVDLEAKRRLTTHLQRAGADISELNTVRRHLSRVKGGGLLAATPARVLSLLLSDVPGDAPWDIASGPGVADPTTFADALDVIRRFPGEATASAAEAFERGARGELPETVKPGSTADARSASVVIGSSRTLLAEAAAYLERSLGVQAVVLHHDLAGEASELAEGHAQLAAALLDGGDARPVLPLLASDPPYVAWRLSRLQGSKPVALLSGGEATVTVRGRGSGGRNQEFALAFALALARRAPEASVWALSAGSDGIDGSSDAAGAFVTPDTLARASERGLDPEAMLRDNDSAGFFRALGDQLVTGQTGHNLNDIRIVLLPPLDPA